MQKQNGFEMVDGKEVMRVSIKPFGDWKREVAEGNLFDKQKAKSERENARRNIERLQREIVGLREEIKKPLPKAKKPTKENYVAWFEKCKKNTEEREDQIWVGGDEPNFEEEGGKQ